ncbi:MAG: Pyridoxine 5'-phosphate synthase [Planctomycetes bacterium ADurb.Bin126]|nr:MAG: Pyridoxine 5'-phosphate synthase [Planctomycetes bacterium ADurb.Bin126]HOD83885.1 pyridoxine 5'-phosphate synthase [Phycisphaerae bacterium]HQL73969.1 pyridoxine 5'-phosphate synthase [Phycisphaerae bacterium]
MAGLGVNIDHVATIRQARRTVEPDPVWAAAEAVLGGADCITFHLRKDRRHINDRDARLLRETVRCKLNMEMSLDEEIVQIALDLRPDQATLVPENRQEITTEGGLDVVAHSVRMGEVVRRLHGAGIVVSAFIDPQEEQIRTSSELRCEAIEIHTGTYANARAEAVEPALASIRDGLGLALEVGLVVHAGHGLTYQNVHPVAAMAGFTEFNIGHSIISRAVFTGLRQATADMKHLLERALR